MVCASVAARPRTNRRGSGATRRGRRCRGCAIRRLYSASKGLWVGAPPHHRQYQEHHRILKQDAGQYDAADDSRLKRQRRAQALGRQLARIA